MMIVALAPTGANPVRHTVAELAAVDPGTGQRWHLAVPLTCSERILADPTILNIARYSERAVAQHAHAEAGEFPSRLRTLAHALIGATLASSDPDGVAAYLMPLLERWRLPALWHPRTADIGTLTAGAHGIEPTRIPSLRLCCTLWGVEPRDLDTPVGVAEAVTACFAAYSRHSRGPWPTRPSAAGPPPRMPCLSRTPSHPPLPAPFLSMGEPS
ncbi:hypothetical protein [Nocardia sp. IFM 10818]